MTKMLIIWACLLGALAAHAQTPDVAPVLSSDAERALISTEKARLETVFTSEQAACYKKFMVNNCLDEIKVRRREALTTLRKREIFLDDRDRKARGVEELQKIDARSAPEKQQEAANRRAESLKEAQARNERENQKNIEREKSRASELGNSDAATARLQNNQNKALAREATKASKSDEARKFAERQAEAKERRARHEREQLNRAKPPAKPLPALP